MLPAARPCVLCLPSAGMSSQEIENARKLLPPFTSDDLHRMLDVFQTQPSVRRTGLIDSLEFKESMAQIFPPVASQTHGTVSSDRRSIHRVPYTVCFRSRVDPTGCVLWC
jgi:hypothetical protein